MLSILKLYNEEIDPCYFLRTRIQDQDVGKSLKGRARE